MVGQVTPGEWIALGSFVLAVVSLLGGLLRGWLAGHVTSLRAEVEKAKADARRAGEACIEAAELERVERRVDTVWVDVGNVREAQRAHELKVAEQYVRHEHLDAMEKRIIARFDRLEASFDRALTAARTEAYGGQQ